MADGDPPPDAAAHGTVARRHPRSIRQFAKIFGRDYGNPFFEDTDDDADVVDRRDGHLVEPGAPPSRR